MGMEGQDYTVRRCRLANCAVMTASRTGLPFGVSKQLGAIAPVVLHLSRCSNGKFLSSKARHNVKTHIKSSGYSRRR